LDVERRKRLIISGRDTYSIRLTGIGTLASNSMYGYVLICTERGDILIPVDPQEIIDDFDGSLDQSVQYDVLVEVDHGEHIRKVLDVFDVGVVDASIEAGMLRSQERFAEIGRLQEGWLDGIGAAIEAAALQSAQKFVHARIVHAASMKIYPNEGAGVLIELEASGWDMSLEFAANGSVQMYGIEVDGDDELEPQAFAYVGEQLLAAFDAKVRR